MAYTPKEWQCGDIVTAEALDNIEGGIQEALDGASPSIKVAHVTADITNDNQFENVQSDADYNELSEVLENGGIVMVQSTLREQHLLPSSDSVTTTKVMWACAAYVKSVPESAMYTPYIEAHFDYTSLARTYRVVISPEGSTSIVS